MRKRLTDRVFPHYEASRPHARAQGWLRVADRKTILLVDDEGSIRNVLRQTLELCGYRVLEASDGYEAMDIFARERSDVDVLVTDAVMPRLSGHHLIRELRMRRPELPVIVLSGHVDGRAECPPDTYVLHKPFFPQQLASVIQDVLSSGALRESPRGRIAPDPGLPDPIR